MARLVAKKKKQAGPEFLPYALSIAEAADEHKAIEIKGYDVRGLTLIADCFIICSAASEPQMKAILNGVRRRMRDQGIRALNVEGEAEGGWLLLDFGDIIFHCFREEAREFYDLDGLWADAPQLDLELDGD